MALVSLTRKWLRVKSEVPALTVPAGDEEVLAPETEFTIVHQLGGDFTIRTRYGTIYRVEGRHAEGLGQALPKGSDAPQEFSQDTVRAQLKKVYDPEIPVDIVELGLVYATEIKTQDDGSHALKITMTLTAPGCGMGQVLVDDVKRKLMALPGVSQVDVDLVFDPPWQASMMSDEARLEAGLF